MILVFKSVLVLMLLFIIFNLAKALILMVRSTPSDEEDVPSMSRYLGRRVLFSALVVVILIIALTSGYLEPNPRPY